MIEGNMSDSITKDKVISFIIGGFKMALALSFSIVGAKVVLFFYLQIISRKKCGFPAKKCQIFYKIRGFYGLNGDGLVFLPETRFVSGCGNPWILWFLPDLSEELSRDSIIRSVACMDRNAEPYNPRV